MISRLVLQEFVGLLHVITTHTAHYASLVQRLDGCAGQAYFTCWKTHDVLLLSPILLQQMQTSSNIVMLVNSYIFAGNCMWPTSARPLQGWNIQASSMSDDQEPEVWLCPGKPSPDRLICLHGAVHEVWVLKQHVPSDKCLKTRCRWKHSLFHCIYSVFQLVI
jgi:hypothetical protein